MKYKIPLLILTFLFFPIFSFSNEADVLHAKANCTKERICSFAVTIKHNDEGWRHYINGYEILSLSKKQIAKRVLHHPHVKEQPFTRSISNVKIPKNVNSVIIRAHDIVHGTGGKEIVLKLFNNS